MTSPAQDWLMMTASLSPASVAAVLVRLRSSSTVLSLVLSNLRLSATGQSTRAKEGAWRKVRRMSPELGGSLCSWEVCSRPLIASSLIFN